MKKLKMNDKTPHLKWSGTRTTKITAEYQHNIEIVSNHAAGTEGNGIRRWVLKDNNNNCKGNNKNYMLLT